MHSGTSDVGSPRSWRRGGWGCSDGDRSDRTDATLNRVGVEEPGVPDVELDLPDDLYAQFQRMADEEFVSEQDAIEHLLSAGLEAYRTTETEEPAGTDLSEEFAEDMWDTAEDPGARGEDDPGDDYTF